MCVVCVVCGVGVCVGLKHIIFPRKGIVNIFQTQHDLTFSNPLCADFLKQKGFLGRVFVFLKMNFFAALQLKTWF